MGPTDPGDAADDAPGASRNPADRRALLEATAAAAFPDADLAAVAELPGAGPHVVGSVTTAEGECFVLKCATTGGHVPALRRETAVTAFVGRETGVPVPAVLDAAFEPADAPTPYLALAWVDGRSLQDAAGTVPRPVQLAMFRALGETLATLHADTAFDEPGSIVPTDREPGGSGGPLAPDAVEVETDGPWPERFAGELADHVEALAGTRFEALAEECWDDLVGRLPALDTGERPVLLHGDVGDGNVVFDGTAVAGVLDWERASVGHPEYDLCRAEVRYFWSGWGERDAPASMLYAGYRSHRDLAEGFDARRRVYLATFYLLSLSTYGDWAPRYADDLDAFAERVAAKVRGVLDPEGDAAPT